MYTIEIPWRDNGGGRNDPAGCSQLERLGQCLVASQGGYGVVTLEAVPYLVRSRGKRCTYNDLGNLTTIRPFTLSTFPVLTGEGDRCLSEAPDRGEGLGLLADRKGVVLLCLMDGLDGPEAEGSDPLRSNLLRAWWTEPVLAAEKNTPRRLLEEEGPGESRGKRVVFWKGQFCR